MFKTLTVKNTTHYVDLSRSKICNSFRNPSAFQSEELKRQSYEARLYYEYLDCQRRKCPVFFYTLTFNNMHLPHYEGHVCFDNKILMQFMNSLRKRLVRDYGCNFKYFVSCEMGEGAGTRKEYENPHYHVLFFTYAEPDHYFVRPTVYDFKKLVRLYWMGQEKVGYINYKTAKYGISMEGDHCGLVLNFNACTYVAKYVCKDTTKWKNIESTNLSDRLYSLVDDEQNSKENMVEFFKSEFNPLLEGKSPQEWYDEYIEFLDTIPFTYDDLDSEDDYDDEENYREYLDKKAKKRVILDHIKKYKRCDDILSHLDVIETILYDFNLYDNEYYSFCCYLSDDKVSEQKKEFRSRYCPKVMISQGVGKYALDFINPDHPYVVIQTTKGPQSRPVSLYYYRKIYCDTLKDEKGQNIYVLNSRGIDMRMRNLSKELTKLIDDTRKVIQLFRDDSYKAEFYANQREYLFHPLNKYNTSLGDIWNDIHSDEDFDMKLNNIENKLYDYAIYKKIYEWRSYRQDGDSVSVIDPEYDYSCFLHSPALDCSYLPNGFDDISDSETSKYNLYCDHPRFKCNIGLFTLLDCMVDYAFWQKDKAKRRRYEERNKVRKQQIVEKISTFFN
ncbi:replication initiator protein [Capybara microvirus Cap1_SP_87]|nr:replication initiator protein [Capybara microvirus Cap1_SP_87]